MRLVGIDVLDAMALKESKDIGLGRLGVSVGIKGTLRNDFKSGRRRVR